MSLDFLNRAPAGILDYEIAEEKAAVLGRMGRAQAGGLKMAKAKPR